MKWDYLNFGAVIFQKSFMTKSEWEDGDEEEEVTEFRGRGWSETLWHVSKGRSYGYSNTLAIAYKRTMQCDDDVLEYTCCITAVVITEHCIT